MTTIEYNSRGEKCIVEVSEGVTRDEITSLRLPDLGEPTTQDRLVNTLTWIMKTCIKSKPGADVRPIIVKQVRALLASLEGEK